MNCIKSLLKRFKSPFLNKAQCDMKTGELRVVRKNVHKGKEHSGLNTHAESKAVHTERAER